jgi:6-methylsalicylate decarboxylase
MNDVTAQTRSAEEIRAEMRSFNFDTALVAPSGLPSLLAFAPQDHIVFGTDYPYASKKVSKTFTAQMDCAPELTVGQLGTINSGAALLLPHLAARKKSLEAQGR